MALSLFVMRCRKHIVAHSFVKLQCSPFLHILNFLSSNVKSEFSKIVVVGISTTGFVLLSINT